nr:DoxX family protein [Streptomyces sp. SID5469]
MLLAGLLATAGVAHFAAPRQFDATIPRALPGKPRTWTYASGIAELALAAGVALPRTRRAAALATAAFFVGVFPANVQMAVDWRHRPAPLRTAALARLPLQVPLVLWARGVAKGAEGRS